jgi:hypothetical protein
MGIYPYITAPTIEDAVDVPARTSRRKVPTSPIAAGYQTFKECFMGLLEDKVALVVDGQSAT